MQARNRQSTYRVLTKDDIATYLRHTGHVSDDDDVTITHVDSSHQSHVFRICVNGTRRLVLKQTVPQDSSGTTEANVSVASSAESDYVSFYERYVSYEVVHRLWHDDAMMVDAYEDLSGMMTMRDLLVAGTLYAHTPVFLGKYLAHEMFYSSTFSLPMSRKAQLERTFSNGNVRERVLPNASSARSI